MDPICDPGTLHQFQFTMPADNNDGSANLFCGGTRENVAYFSFIAWTDNMEITLRPTNCSLPPSSSKKGIQASIFSLDENCEAIIEDSDCSCSPNVEDIMFVLAGLVPGRQYYIFLDGCANINFEGDVCDIEVLINLDATILPAYSLPPNMELSIEDSSGEEIYCEGETVVIDIAAIRGNDVNYEFTIQELYEDGTLNTQIIDTDTFAQLLIVEGLEKIYFDVLVSGSCDPGILVRDSILISDTDLEIFRDTSICFGETLILPFWQGSILNQEGFYSDTIVQSSGCKLVQQIQLDFYPLQTAQVDTLVCDFPISVAGEIINAPISNQRIVLAGQDMNGCDSIIDLTVREAFFDGLIQILDCNDAGVKLGFEVDTNSDFDSLNLVWEYDASISTEDTLWIANNNPVILHVEFFINGVSCNMDFSENITPLIFDGNFVAECSDGMVDLSFMESSSAHDNATYNWIIDGAPMFFDATSITIDITAEVMLEVTASNASQYCTFLFGPFQYWENEIIGDIAPISCLDDSIMLIFELLQGDIDNAIYNWSSSNGENFNSDTIHIPASNEIFLELDLESNGNNCKYNLGPYTFNNEINCDESCIDASLDFTANIDTFCYDINNGVVSLPLAVNAVSNMGLTGTGSWLNPEVDNNGIFTIQNFIDSTYVFEYLYDEDGCRTTGSFVLTVLEMPNIEIAAANDSFCLDQTIQLNANINGSYDEVIWDLGDATYISGDLSGPGPIEITLPDASIYVFSASANNGSCRSSSELITIEGVASPLFPIIDCVPSANEIELSWTGTSDCNDSYEIYLDGTLIETTTDTEYTIPNLVSNTVYNIEVVHVYDCICRGSIFDQMECMTSDCANINLQLEQDIIRLCHPSEALQELVYSFDNSDPLFDPAIIWEGSNVDQNGMFDATGLDAGSYMIKLSLIEGSCLYTDSVELLLLEAPNIDLVVSTSNCLGDNSGSLRILVNSLAMIDQLTINGDAVNDPSAVPILTDVDYTVIAIDENGCSTEESVNLSSSQASLLTILGPDTLLLDSIGVYNFNVEPLISTSTLPIFNWYVDGLLVCTDSLTGSCSNLPLSGSEDFEICLEITYNEDCLLSNCKTIKIQEIEADFYFPNAFSPISTNGTNDNWRIYSNADNFMVNELKIYDRWGNLVHKLKDQAAENGSILLWDGRREEEKLNSAVFIYLIDLQVGNTIYTRKGSLTLIK